jgi:hypothetical protein
MIDAWAGLSDFGSATSLAACAVAKPARPERTVLAISKRQCFVIFYPVV